MSKIGITDAYLPNPEETLSLWNIKRGQIGFDSFPEVSINNMIYRGNF